MSVPRKSRRRRALGMRRCSQSRQPRLRLSGKTARRIAELDAVIETGHRSSVAERIFRDIIEDTIKDAAKGRIPTVADMYGVSDAEEDAETVNALKRLALRWAAEDERKAATGGQKP